MVGGMDAGLVPLSARMSIFAKAGSRFTVVSSYFPPIVGGTATVVHNLLTGFRRDAFTVVAEDPSSFDGTHLGRAADDMNVVRFGVPAFITQRIPYGVKWARWLRFALIPRIEAAIKASKPDLVIAVYPSWPFLIAAYRAARGLGVPFYTYHMDVTAPPADLRWPDRLAAAFHDTRIIREASGRFALSAGVRENFRARLGLDTTVIHHSVQVREPLPPSKVSVPTSGRTVVHTGVVEELQTEGLLRIKETLDQNPSLNARLLLSTPTHRASLALFGGVEIKALPHDKVSELQASADILVAVLPFNTGASYHQLTSFPTKVTEYMLSGVPILAHAPRESYFSRHVAEHGYAYLVDTPSHAALAAAIRELFGNENLRAQLTDAARRTVREIFSSTAVAREFAAACNLSPSLLLNS